MLDLYVFSNKIENIYETEKIGRKYLVKNIDKNDRFLCSFEHIFSGGYSAGYYSYLWAEIMSLDAFILAFEEVGLNNEEKIQELGIKFRNTILSKGGGTNPLKVFKEFRGREPNSDAYMKNYGLIE